MKILLLTLLFFLMTPSTPSLAGLIKGNGGNTLVCLDRVELIDIVESKELDWYRFDGQDLSARAWERAKKYLSTSEFTQIQKWWFDWENETQWQNGGSLGKVHDSFHFIVPPDCEVIQTVVARDPLPGEKRYLAREDLYLRLSLWERDALIWHETLYRYVIRQRLKRDLPIEKVYDSQSTRRMVAALYADNTNDWQERDWQKIFRDLR